MGDGTCAEIAAALYALRPDEFTAARDAAARRARDGGDRDLAGAIKQWRRPSIGAWLVNQLARTHPDALDDLLDLGTALREAQHTLDGAELRALSRRRHQVIRSLSEVSRTVADDQNIGDTARREFEATLDAALADEAAASAVRTGRLMRPLEPGGLDAVDLDGAVAAPDAAPPRRRPRPARKKPDDTRAKAKEAAAREAEARDGLAAAEHDLADRDTELSAARIAARTARTTVADLEAALDEARRQLTSADAARRDAETAHKAAARARDAARRALDTARRKRE
ncbi:MAG: hypothetical protein ACRDVG_15745 [Jatrophihabitantaceae bacterium]